MNGATWNGAYDMITTVGDPSWRIVALRDVMVTGTVKAPGGNLAFYPAPGLFERIAPSNFSGFTRLQNHTLV
jgi:hypothetical protein